MNVKFEILFDDGTVVSSHDESWTQVMDHANFLPPTEKRKWVEYALVTDGTPQQRVTVNLLTGVFLINGVMIHPAVDEGEVMTHKKEPQDFPTTEAWKNFNGYPYFPIVGRRVFKGDIVDATLYYCGWKRKFDKRTIIKLCFIYPNGQIVLT